MNDEDSPVIRVAVDALSRVGEGPVWDARSMRLHWVDIPGGQIHTSDLTTGWSSTFAGPLLDVLCVTSAREGLGLADDDPCADGSVLAVTGLGVRGLRSGQFAG